MSEDSPVSATVGGRRGCVNEHVLGEAPGLLDGQAGQGRLPPVAHDEREVLVEVYAVARHPIAPDYSRPTV